jgi:hypothetical protein
MKGETLPTLVEDRKFVNAKIDPPALLFYRREKPWRCHCHPQDGIASTPKWQW